MGAQQSSTFRRHRYDNGNEYEGQFLKGKRHGRGKYTWTDGSVYDGDWLNGEQNGLGTLSMFNGNVFEGQFRHNNPDGECKLTTKDGVVIEGNFKCYGRTPHGEPVTVYYLEVVVTFPSRDLRVEYRGGATFRTMSGLVILPNLADPEKALSALPVATATAVINVASPVQSFVEFNEPLTVAQPLLSGEHELTQVDQQLLMQSEAEITQAIQAGQGLLLGVADPALREKRVEARYKINVLDIRNYF